MHLYRAPILLTALLAASLVIAACGGSAPASQAPTPTPTAVAPPLTADEHFVRGNNLFERQLLGAAIREYDLATALDSKHVQAYLQKGISHRMRGQFDEALTNFSRAAVYAGCQGL